MQYTMRIVSREVFMEQISELCNISMEELKALNPQYRTTRIPGNAQPCTLRMPMAAINAFIECGDSIYTHRLAELSKRRSVVNVNEKAASSKSSSAKKTVTVRSGDTLGAIAKRNGTTVNKIMKLNGMKSHAIRVGQKIRVK